jgi:hypothetical protein
MGRFGRGSVRPWRARRQQLALARGRLGGVVGRRCTGGFDRGLMWPVEIEVESESVRGGKVQLVGK